MVFYGLILSLKIMNYFELLKNFSINLNYYFYNINFSYIGIILFMIGLFGLFATRRNMIVVLMSIEIMLLASTYTFVLFSIYLDDIIGQFFGLIILTVAAAESALALAIIILHYRHRSLISIDSFNYLKG
jgi:NADH-quinone oxidoreductase subunit K